MHHNSIFTWKIFIKNQQKQSYLQQFTKLSNNYWQWYFQVAPPSYGDAQSQPGTSSFAQPQPTVQQPAVQQPIVQQPTVHQPMMQQPIMQQPVQGVPMQQPVQGVPMQQPVQGVPMQPQPLYAMQQPAPFAPMYSAPHPHQNASNQESSTNTQATGIKIDFGGMMDDRRRPRSRSPSPKRQEPKPVINVIVPPPPAKPYLVLSIFTFFCCNALIGEYHDRCKSCW